MVIRPCRDLMTFWLKKETMTPNIRYVIVSRFFIQTDINCVL